MRSLLTPLFLLGCGKIAPPAERPEPREAYSRSCSEALTCSVESGEPTCQEDYLPTNDQRHLDGDIEYPVYPPAGGAHYRCWWDWGVFETEVPEERWVHNQEHGGVVFLYNCPEGCADEVAALAAVFGPRERVIVTPDTDMKWKFAAAAWEYRIMMDCLDIEALASFYDAHMGNAPEDVASMAPTGCMDEEPDSGDSSDDTGEAADTGTSN